MCFLYKKANNPLHIAVIDNNISVIQELAHNDEFILERNEIGLTPVELAQFLLRKEALTVFQMKDQRPIKIIFADEKETKLLSSDEMDRAFDMIFTRHLFFPNYDILKQTINSLPFTYEKNNFLGRLFECEIITGFCADVKIRWVDNILGYGVFADEDLEKDSFVGEYVGIVRPLCRIYSKENEYCFHYPTKFWSMEYLVIDSLKVGNELRFVNHSDIPNLVPNCMTIRSLIHIVLMTTRKIKKGEQLTFDYGEDYWKRRQKI